MRRMPHPAGGAEVRGLAEGPPAPSDRGVLGVRVPAARALVLDEQAFGGDRGALGDALPKLRLPYDKFGKPALDARFLPSRTRSSLWLRIGCPFLLPLAVPYVLFALDQGR